MLQAIVLAGSVDSTPRTCRRAREWYMHALATALTYILFVDALWYNDYFLFIERKGDYFSCTSPRLALTWGPHVNASRCRLSTAYCKLNIFESYIVRFTIQTMDYSRTCVGSCELIGLLFFVLFITHTVPSVWPTLTVFTSVCLFVCLLSTRCL